MIQSEVGHQVESKQCRSPIGRPGKLLFEDGQPLTFGEFLEGMLMLRGSNQTTVKDGHGMGATRQEAGGDVGKVGWFVGTWMFLQ